VAFGAALVVAGMSASLVEQRGGEGGRPVEGARCDVSGRERFSLGLRNIRQCVSSQRGVEVRRCGVTDGKSTSNMRWFAPRDRAITCERVGPRAP
jgi:hypothetical protein